MRSFAMQHPILIVIGLTIIVVIAWHLIHPRTRTDSIQVTAIYDGYRILIRSEGTYLLPLSPDGPFPKWMQETELFADGAGMPVTIDGLAFKKYTIGKDLQGGWFANGWAAISEGGKRLILQTELEKDRRYLINHSGTYNGITVDHPQIFPLLISDKMEDLDGRYIHAKGHYRDWTFEAAGKKFEVQSSDLNETPEYEVIGLVRLHCPYSSGGPYLVVISRKRVGPK
jgi:hypothetical protein